MKNPALKQAILTLGLFGSMFIGYWAVVQKLLLRWNTGDDNYCYLVLPLFLYLCWEKSDEFRFGELSWSPWGIVTALFSAVLMYVGELGSIEPFLYAGLWGCVLSVFLTLYGLRVRTLAFAFLILLFIVPLPPFLNKVLTFKLKMLASDISVDALRLFGVSVVQEGNIIDLGVDRLEVADACSGLRYFMPMVLMGLLVAHFFTRGFWRRLVILLLVVPLSIIINIGRIFFAGLATAHGHAELARNMFHDFSGWVAFMAAGVVLVVVASLLRRVGHPPGQPTVAAPVIRSRGHGPGFVLTSAAVCAVFLLGGLAVSNASSLARSPSRTTFDRFPMEIGPWQGERSFLSAEELRSLWADDYVSATFRKAGSPNMVHLLIPFYAYQGTRHTVHAPQSCLLGGGWSILSSGDVQVPVGGRVIPVRLMSLVRDDSRLLGSYFYLQRGRVLTDPWMSKWYLLRDSITRRRTDGALVRVELLMGPGVSDEDARQELESFIAGLWEVLPAYVPD